MGLMDSIETDEEMSKSGQIVKAPSISPSTQKLTVKRKKNIEKEGDVTKYCICRQPERHPMIGCDFCDEWYHGSCLNLKKDDIKELTKCDWKCPKCELPNSKQEKTNIEESCLEISTTIKNSPRKNVDELLTFE